MTPEERAEFNAMASVQNEPVRRAAVLAELRRLLRLVYGDDWEEVYEDLITSWDPGDYED